MAATRDIAARTLPALSARALAALLYLAVGVSALLPRALDLGGFLTVDEANFWLDRSAAFLDALRRGDWAATAISTHPGVTTMWLGGAGLLLREALVDPGLLPGDFATSLALMRLPGAIVHAAAVVVGYGMLRRLLPHTAALLAGLLWAADPFVVAYSRLLHVDALAGTFMTLSVLAALGGVHNGKLTMHTSEQRQSPRVLHVAWCFSGVFGGLALLSKSPSLVLLPVIGIIALVTPVLTAQRTWRSRERLWRAAFSVPGGAANAFGVQRYAVCGVRCACWALAAALTAFALWPALWVDPLGALAWLRTGVEAEGAQPHMLGNFFLGRQDDAPGPLFYPVALALRLTPVSLLGLLLLPLGARRMRPEHLRALALLALFVLLLVAGLSVFPKKFNRYIVPAFPALDILAAVGLCAAAGWAAGRTRAWVTHAAVAAVGALACLNIAAWHPFTIAAFNQALGGAPAGARTFAVGWGEGMEQAAAWLNKQPDITGVSVVSRIPVVQAPYMRRGAYARTPVAGALPEGAGYVVVYISQVQRGLPSPPFDRFYARATPLHTVRIHSVEYAWVYQVPPDVAEPRPAVFGEGIALRGFTWLAPPHRGEPARLALHWQAHAAAPLDYVLFAHVIGPDGQRAGQADLPLATSTWLPGSYPATELPLALPADAPAGMYRVVVGLYSPADGRRLPLATALPLDPALSGADALPLAEFVLP